MTIPLNQIIGIKHSRLTPIREVKKEGGCRHFRCECECGKVRDVALHGLRSGKTQSCGCLQRERVAQSVTKHGLADHYLYNTWSHMRARCNNPNAVFYASYGGRGISMFKPWVNDVELFIIDILSELGHRPSAQHSMDRVDNDGNYEISNLRWATPKQQCNNQRRNIRHLTLNGKAQSMRDWAAELGIPSPTIRKRMRRGLNDADCLSLISEKSGKHLTQTNTIIDKRGSVLSNVEIKEL